MIEITEVSPPGKVSGLSSFVVRSEYSEALVAALKALPNWYYHKKDRIWEIPANCLAQLLDSAVFVDQVRLNLLDWPEGESESGGFHPLSQEEIAGLKQPPFKHQIEAVDFGLKHPKWLLLDCCGLGKTAEIIWLAEALKRRGAIEHCFIVCGVNAVKQNWKKEISRFSNESCRILGERISKKGRIHYASLPERAKELKGEIAEFFVITNVETLRSPAVTAAFLKPETKFGMIVVDEIHKCLTGDSVVLTDIGKLTLSEISHLEALPKVLSYNKKTGQNEFRQISSVTESQPREPLLELTLIDDNRTIKLKCTASHKIYTNNRGWVKAKDLTADDDIKTAKGIAAVQERSAELWKTPEYRQRMKDAAKISGEKRKKLYWEAFISAHGVKIEDYKRDYLKYKNNCPNRHLELICLIPYNQIRALNRYLGLSGGGSWHKNGKVSI